MLQQDLLHSHSRTLNIECEKDLRLSPSLLPFNDTHALSSCGRQPTKAQHGEGRQKLRGKEAPSLLLAVGTGALKQKQGSPGLATCLWIEMRVRGIGGLNGWMEADPQEMWGAEEDGCLQKHHPRLVCCLRRISSSRSRSF